MQVRFAAASSYTTISESLSAEMQPPPDTCQCERCVQIGGVGVGDGRRVSDWRRSRVPGGMEGMCGRCLDSIAHHSQKLVVAINALLVQPTSRIVMKRVVSDLRKKLLLVETDLSAAEPPSLDDPVCHLNPQLTPFQLRRYMRTRKL